MRGMVASVRFAANPLGFLVLVMTILFLKSVKQEVPTTSFLSVKGELIALKICDGRVAHAIALEVTNYDVAHQRMV